MAALLIIIDGSTGAVLKVISSVGATAGVLLILAVLLFIVGIAVYWRRYYYIKPGIH